jgi:hypothetical protein
MALAWKILAGLIVLIGTVSFPSSLFLNQSFRAFYWNLFSQNSSYAAIGAIATFSFIIALGSLLWHKE